MPVYNFTFPAAFAGKAYTVTDLAGSSVNTGSLPSTLGTDDRVTLSVTLDAGDYIATAGDPAYSERCVSGEEIDLAASIAAAGGVTTTGSNYYFEIDNGLTLATGNHVITWDTVYGSEDGYADYSGDMQQLALGKGIYVFDWLIEVSAPSTSRFLGSQMGVGGMSVSSGLVYVSPDAPTNYIANNGVVVIKSDSLPASLTIGHRVTDSADASPEDLNVTFGALSAYKIA